MRNGYESAYDQIHQVLLKSRFRCGRRDAHHLPEEYVCCTRGPYLPGSRYVQTMPERRPCRSGSLYTFHSVQILGRWIIRRYLQSSSCKINPKANIYTKERFLVHSKLRADLLLGSLPFSRSKMPPHGPTQSAPPFSSLSS